MDDIWDDEPSDTNYDKLMAERQWNKLQSEHGIIGYREGIVEGKQVYIQQGFNIGLTKGVSLGVLVGKILGVIETLQLVIPIKSQGVVEQMFKSLPSNDLLAQLELFRQELLSLESHKFLSTNDIQSLLTSSSTSNSGSQALASEGWTSISHKWNDLISRLDLTDTFLAQCEIKP